MFCANCGKEIDDNAVVCVNCGCATSKMTNTANKSMLTAVLLWLFLGSLGAHRFYLGHTNSAVLQMLLTIIGWATIIIVIGFVPLLIVGFWLLIDIFMMITGKLKPSDGSALV